MKVNSIYHPSKSNLLKLIDNIRKSSFFKNILVVMSGVAIAQVVTYALSPLISRLFSPSDYGVYGAFDAVLSIITSGVTLQYTQAIQLSREKSDAINLVVLSWISATIINGVCLMVCLLFPSFTKGLIKAPNAWMLVLMIVAIQISGINQACQAWCIRVKSFKHTSASQVINSVSTNSIYLGMGYLRGGPFVLVYGPMLGQALSCVNLFSVLWRDLRRLFSCIRLNRIIQLAKEYRDFPMYSATQNVLNWFSQGLPVIFFSHFYGTAVAGAYAFGVRVILAPMRFILLPLNQVLYQKVCESQNRNEPIFHLYVKITLGLFVLTFLPATIMIIWAPQLFSWVFGTQWHAAGEYARNLIIWLMFAFCNLPAVLFAKAIRIQRFVFLYDLCLLAARASALGIGRMFLDPLGAIMLFAIVGAAMETFFIFRVGYAVMKREKLFILDSA